MNTWVSDAVLSIRITKMKKKTKVHHDVTTAVAKKCRDALLTQRRRPGSKEGRYTKTLPGRSNIPEVSILAFTDLIFGEQT